MAALKGIVDTAIIPATRRAIRDAMTAKTKAMIAAAKAAKEEAKAAAVKAVGEKAEAAKSASAPLRRQARDSTDPAALKDAAAAFKAAACALFACDPVKGKAMCYVSVPPAVEGIDVKGWLDACCGPIGGKGAAARAAPRRDGKQHRRTRCRRRRRRGVRRGSGSSERSDARRPRGPRLVPAPHFISRSERRAPPTAERVASKFHTRARHTHE